MSNQSPTSLYLPSGFDAMDMHERRRFFKENADRIEEQRTVVRPLSEEEKLDYKDQLAQESLRLRELTQEKKDRAKAYNDRIKEVKGAIDPILNSLNTGFDTVVDDVFWLFDQDKGTAVGFTLDGNIVDERRLRPDERQARIKTMTIGGN